VIRQLYHVPDLSRSSSEAVPVLPDNEYGKALSLLGIKPNCIGSKLADGSGFHAPALDIDFPCLLIPSSTRGHFHLYIDKPIEWGKYVKLLWALVDAGILEYNYVAASVRDGATILRRPGVKK
jgi:hypothetical protein